MDYVKLAATVTALMNTFGTPNCRVVRAATAAIDPDRPWKGEDQPDAVVVASCHVLLGGVSRLRPGGPHVIRGSGESPTVYEQSTMFMSAADGAKARAGDFVEVPAVGGGYDRLAIGEITPIKPGGVNLLWQITVKGA